MALARSWDIFCNVVDNYGDVGVSWRLARQLAADHGLQIRLWLDDVATLKKICPELDTALTTQRLHGVEIRNWPSQSFPEVQPAEVVVEAFGCELPPGYVMAMAQQRRSPIWINLEYLSAEPWVEGCHRLASPHPRLPLVKYFFFPGFTAATGGLLREHKLLERRDAFRQDPEQLAAFWDSLQVAAPQRGEYTVSLFCYPNPAIGELLSAWVAAEFPVHCLVAEGKILEQICIFFQRPHLAVGETWSKGNLQLQVLPFIEQTRYDKLLWACDCNLVRGEDSFVRAQWAGKAMIWQIYPQSEGAHWKKLDAFLDCYCAGLPEEAAAACRAMWQAWNRGEGAGAAWQEFWRQRQALERHAEEWARRLSQQEDLASNLVHFCRDKL